MNDEIEAARAEWREGRVENALLVLKESTLKDTYTALFLQGEIQYSLQNWGEALNSFRHCLQLDPDSREAKTYVELILNILGFFHTDQFNP